MEDSGVIAIIAIIAGVSTTIGSIVSNYYQSKKLEKMRIEADKEKNNTAKSQERHDYCFSKEEEGFIIIHKTLARMILKCRESYTQAKNGYAYEMCNFEEEITKYFNTFEDVSGAVPVTILILFTESTSCIIEFNSALKRYIEDRTKENELLLDDALHQISPVFASICALIDIRREGYISLDNSEYDAISDKFLKTGLCK